MFHHAILATGFWAATLAGLTLIPAPAAAEDVDHPTYLSWAGKPIGTTITLRTRTEAKGHVLTTTNKTTLKELRPDVAVLEIVRISDATGTRQEKAPELYRQLRKFPLFPGVKPQDVGKPLGALKQGDETIKLADQSFHAIWFDSKTRGDGGLDWFTRTWLAEEVPGRLLKSVTEIPEAKTTVTTELIAYQTP